MLFTFCTVSTDDKLVMTATTNQTEVQRPRGDDEVLRALQLPKHDSTKGTTAFEQNLSIKGNFIYINIRRLY